VNWKRCFSRFWELFNPTPFMLRARTLVRDGNNEQYVMNADGRGVIGLTDNLADDEVPDWSP
jgi:hypothetical protein